MYGRNELNMQANLFDHVMGHAMTVDIHVNFRVALTYNQNTKRFDITKTHQSHHNTYHKEWYVIVLEIVTLGIFSIVTEVIKLVANSLINDKMQEGFDFNSENGGLPINIGGVVGEVFDNMNIGKPFFYNNNFVFPFTINFPNLIDG